MFLYRYDRRGLNANDASIWRLGIVRWAAGSNWTEVSSFRQAGWEDSSEVKLERL